jgi:hypothetical protein
MIPSHSVENALPAAGTPPPPEAERAPPVELEAAREPDDAAAWAVVLAGWDDDARHRAYLDRFTDLDGLASAGRRYRDALAARPGDPIAARFRDEVLRRAVAHGLASLPRTEPELPRARLAIRIAAGVVIAGLLLAAALMIARLVPLAGAAP